jgi:hypothetical protein
MDTARNSLSSEAARYANAIAEAARYANAIDKS